MTFEQALESFAVVGCYDAMFDLLQPIETIVCETIPQTVGTLQERIAPSYLLERPYRELLIALARGDGRTLSSLRKARIGENAGEAIQADLIASGILRREISRETPVRIYPKQKIKKELRRYRIQDKLRFVDPFYRFWFGFVEPFVAELERGETQDYVANFYAHKERLYSLLFEQLSDAFLFDYFAASDPIVSSGSFWNKDDEFDIVALTQSGRLIVGECKYKDRLVCKNELGKLKRKAAQNGFDADVFVLFAKDGFSNELRSMQDASLLLFDASDMERMCYDGR